MLYKIITEGFKHPIKNKELKIGQVIDLFHEYGDTFTIGENPPLERLKKTENNIAKNKKIENGKG